MAVYPLNHTIHIGKRVRLEWRMEIGTRANALAPKIFITEFGFVRGESSLLRVRSLDRDQQSA